MFKKIKWELIRLNVILSGLVLVFIFAGIFFTTKLRMDREDDSMMENVSLTEMVNPGRQPPELGTKPQDLGVPPPGEGGERRGMSPVFSNLFYVRINENSQVTDVSNNLSGQIEDVDALVEATLSQKTDKGIINNGDYRLKYLITQKSHGRLLVYLDTQPNQNTLNGLLLTSLLIGALSMAMVFAVSYIWTSRALIPLNRAWERQKRFTADASHELRTPLAVLQSNLDILLDNPDMGPDAQRVWLENLHSEIADMTTLTNQLLTLARYDEDGVLERESFNISGMIESLDQTLAANFAKKRLSLEVEMNASCSVYGNAIEIKRLLVILLDNAFKYTPEGGTITLSVVSGEKGTDIHVSDTGIGIKKEDLNKIFERFYRVDKVRSKEIDGFGLGLPIASLIIKKHHGKIDIESEEGKGTRVKVWLPPK